MKCIKTRIHIFVFFLIKNCIYIHVKETLHTAHCMYLVRSVNNNDNNSLHIYFDVIWCHWHTLAFGLVAYNT